MKEFFANLNTRDRRLLIIGCIIVTILFLYGVIWAPLSNKVARLQVTVAEQKQLESWMIQASQEVQRLRKMSAPASGAQPRQSLLALTDQTPQNNKGLHSPSNVCNPRDRTRSIYAWKRQPLMT